MSEQTDPGQIDRRAMRERVERATPGPWGVGNGAPTRAADPDEWTTIKPEVVVPCDSETCGPIPHAPDSDFIAHARTDLPALLDLTDTLVERLRGAVRRLELHKTGNTFRTGSCDCTEFISETEALLASLGEDG